MPLVLLRHLHDGGAEVLVLHRPWGPTKREDGSMRGRSRTSQSYAYGGLSPGRGLVSKNNQVITPWMYMSIACHERGRSDIVGRTTGRLRQPRRADGAEPELVGWINQRRRWSSGHSLFLDIPSGLPIDRASSSLPRRARKHATVTLTRGGESVARPLFRRKPRCTRAGCNIRPIGIPAVVRRRIPLPPSDDSRHIAGAFPEAALGWQ